jgi:hypothetical protein
MELRGAKIGKAKPERGDENGSPMDGSCHFL